MKYIVVLEKYMSRSDITQSKKLAANNTNVYISLITYITFEST